MRTGTKSVFPIGILGVLQTPFTSDGPVDYESLNRLVEHAIESGVDGFLVPAIASENAHLSTEEKEEIGKRVQHWVAGRVPVVWAAGSSDLRVCERIGKLGREEGAAGLLVAVPPPLYGTEEIIPFFEQVGQKSGLPLMIQDWQPGGSGMNLETIVRLAETITAFQSLKIETLPAGPKYTAVLEATRGGLHVAGGWAVSQFIEALDRGVHAMIPESSMIPIYHRIDRLHRSGNREAAKVLFEKLVPVLCFTNQELDTSIRFFKRLLVRKGIFSTAADRLGSQGFDRFSERVAEELIEKVLGLEEELKHAQEKGGT